MDYTEIKMLTTKGQSLPKNINCLIIKIKGVVKQQQPPAQNSAGAAAAANPYNSGNTPSPQYLQQNANSPNEYVAPAASSQGSAASNNQQNPYQQNSSNKID